MLADPTQQRGELARHRHRASSGDIGPLSSRTFSSSVRQLLQRRRDRLRMRVHNSSLLPCPIRYAYRRSLETDIQACKHSRRCSPSFAGNQQLKGSPFRREQQPHVLVEARIRFTAPFNMSGHPTLTLPGGKTEDGAWLAAKRSKSSS
jgi:hypothetical protein